MVNIVLFLFIFGWKVGGISSPIDIISLLSLLSIGFGLFRKEKIPKRVLKITLLLLFVGIYSGILALIYTSNDYYMLMRFTRISLNFIGVYLFVSYLYSKKYDFVDILSMIYKAILFHSLIVIGMYFFDNFRMLILSITGGNMDKFTLRIPGLTYGLSQTSVLHSMGLAIGLCTYNKYKKKKYILIHTLKNIIILCSIMFIGRSGLVMLIPILLFSYCFNLYNSDDTFGQKINKLIAIIMSVLLLVSIFIVFLNMTFDYESELRFTQYHVSEILDIFTGNSTTIDAVKKMFILPKEPLVFIFGNSSIGRSSFYYLPSDIGFIKFIFSIGIFGLTMVMYPYHVFLRRGKMLYGKHVGYGCAYLFIMMSNIILNAKELALYTRGQFTIIVIVYAYLDICSIKGDSLFHKEE